MLRMSEQESFLQVETTMHRESYPILRAVVEKLEGIRIGRGENGVSLISGLDKVVFGTVSAAESISICGKRPYQYIWYMLSGAICDVIQLAMDCFLHFVLGIQDPSVCWATSFAMSIFFRHTTHRYLVFGNYVGGYCNSLMRMYAGYSVIIVISTLFNIFMTKMVKVPHYIAWIITLLWTGVVNFFILKKLWSFGGGGSKTKPVQVVTDSSLA